MGWNCVRYRRTHSEAVRTLSHDRRRGPRGLRFRRRHPEVVGSEGGSEISAPCKTIRDRFCGVVVSADGRERYRLPRTRHRGLGFGDRAGRLTLVGHGVECQCRSHDPRWRTGDISASNDATLEVWNLSVGSDRHTGVSQSPGLEVLAASPNGRLVVSASRITSDGQYALKVWDLQGGKEPCTFKGPPWIKSVVINTGEHRAILACAPDTLKVLDLETGQELLSLDGAARAARDFQGVAVTADGRMAVSASIECDTWAAGADMILGWGPTSRLRCGI